MINIKPILLNIDAFDAYFDHDVLFKWDGNQVFRNTCTIRNNINNKIVYTVTQDTLQLKHTIPKYALVNGNLYNITIKVIDNNGIASEESTPILFYCYTTPSLSFSNMIENQVIQGSSYKVDLLYSQRENELLQYYQLFLYNINKNQIWASGVKYDTSSMSINVNGLEDNRVYYIRATGKTINNMDVDTGYVMFSANYVMPNSYYVLTLENIAKDGSIKIQCNILSIEGTFVGSNISYLNNDYIDLTNSNNSVYFREGINIKDNFSLNIKGYNFTYNYKVLSLSNGTKSIDIYVLKNSYLSDDGKDKLYFKLFINVSEFASYTIESNLIDCPLNNDILSLWLRKVNNVYSLYVENLSV